MTVEVWGGGEEGGWVELTLGAGAPYNLKVLGPPQLIFPRKRLGPLHRATAVPAREKTTYIGTPTTGGLQKG